MSLNPVGGIELCTLQDSVALAARGHCVNLMFGQDGYFRSQYEQAGIGLNGPVSFDFNLRHPFAGLTSFVGPARWARSQSPDILWLNRFEQIAWAETVATWSGIPIVCSLHHFLNPRHIKLLSHRVAHFVAVSSFMRDTWIEAGIPADRISVIHNALPPEQYPRGGLVERSAARLQLGIPQDVPVVLYYGRMVPDKGVGTLLDAWHTLEAETTDAMLIVVGSPLPEVAPEFINQFRRLDPARVRCFPTQGDMIPFLHAADVVVFPTWNQESFGRVITEGMSTGRPVISSRVGATPEILAGSMNRFLVEAKNSDELGAKIVSLLNWRQTEPELEATCSAWVEVQFPFASHVTELEQTLLQYRRSSR
jgi:glycosyltransferase involved in cell wall biosynthesis